MLAEIANRLRYLAASVPPEEMEHELHALARRCEEAQPVWCVVCIEDSKGDVTHIFSSPEKANEFCERDPRGHVTYDYVIDCPERMEQTSN